MKTRQAFQGLQPEAFGFFRQLARPNRARNNSKPWFDRHRTIYNAHVAGALKALFEESAEGVTCGFAAYDGRDSALARSVARIFRDLFPLYAFACLEGAQWKPR